MSIKQKLLEIVGLDNFSDEPEALDKYSKEFSLAPRGVPNYVVKPKDAKEVQKVIKFANERFIPVVPCSSGVHFQGATIPKQGSIILDLTRMNQILGVDELNRRVRMEAEGNLGANHQRIGKKRLQNGNAAVASPPALCSYRLPGKGSAHQYSV